MKTATLTRTTAILLGSLICWASQAPVTQAQVNPAPSGMFYRWQPRVSGATTSLRGIAYSGSRYLAVGKSQHTVSLDGLIWAVRDNREFNEITPHQVSFLDVAYGQGRFVAVGAIVTGEAFTSTDGEDWDNRVIDTPYPIPSVAFGLGRFVSVRSVPKILDSTARADARYWDWVYNDGDGLQPQYLYDVTFDPELSCFVAVGGCGQVLWSASGERGTWNRRVAPTECRPETFVAVAAGRRHWVALDNQGRIYVKPENRDWRLTAKPTTETLNAVAFGEGVFVAVGDRGAMAISSDGCRWFLMYSGVTNKLNNIAHLGGSFFAVGDQGVILQSSPPIAPQAGMFMSSKRETNGSYNMHYFAPPGNHRLEASTNLTYWSPIQNFVSTQALKELTDTNAVTLPHRFYRVVDIP